MADLIWTRRALNDLDEIYSFIAEDSSFFANRTVEQIYSRANKLLRQPYSGRVIPEKNTPTQRQVVEGNYRILYNIENLPDITIMRVFHSARLLGHAD